MIDVELSTILYPGLIILLGSFVQSIAGFGFGLVALPLLMLLGWSLPQSILLLGTNSLFQSSLAGYSLRKHAPWPYIKKACIGRFLFIPIGLITLTYLDSISISYVKVIVASLIPLVLILQRYLPKIKNNKQPSILWTVVAFTSSGFFSSAIGLGGPSLVLWAKSQNWTSHQSKAFTLITFCLTLPVLLPLVYFRFNHELYNVGIICLSSLPFLIFGTKGGLWIGRYINKDSFDKIVVGLLLFLSISILYKLKF